MSKLATKKAGPKSLAGKKIASKNAKRLLSLVGAIWNQKILKSAKLRLKGCASSGMPLILVVRFY